MAIFESLRRNGRLFAMALALSPMAVMASDAAFPSRPIRLVVPFPPGGGTDILARALSARISQDLGQPVVVDNRPGVSTSLGAEIAAKATPDGHTLLIGTGSTYVTNSLLFRKLPYEPQKDLQSLAVISRMDMLLVTHRSMAVDTAQDLVRRASAKPGAMTYASPGVGTVHHLAMELFTDRAGISLTHVPYKGAAETLQDLLGERVDVMFLDFATARRLIDAKRIKVLGVSSLQRLKALPDVPTLAESGFLGFEVSGWFGMSTTARLPAAARATLEKSIASAMTDSQVLEQLVNVGYTPAYASGDDMAKVIAAETEKWGKIIRAKNISTD